MGQQLALYRGVEDTAPVQVARRRQSSGQGAAQAARVRLCASCRAHEARYGFREEPPPRGFGAPGASVADRPRTLCFECFRVEIGRRQAVAERMARGWNGTQASLPLAETLSRLDRRRRRAQIAARHTLDLR